MEWSAIKLWLLGDVRAEAEGVGAGLLTVSLLTPESIRKSEPCCCFALAGTSAAFGRGLEPTCALANVTALRNSLSGALEDRETVWSTTFGGTMQTIDDAEKTPANRRNFAFHRHLTATSRASSSVSILNVFIALLLRDDLCDDDRFELPAELEPSFDPLPPLHTDDFRSVFPTAEAFRSLKNFVGDATDPDAVTIDRRPTPSLALADRPRGG